MEKQPFGALASLFEDEPVPVREESTTASAPPCETQQDSSLKDGVSVGEEEKLPALGIQGGMRFLADCSTGNTPLLADTVRMGMAETLYAYLGRFLPKVYPNEVSHLVESGMVFDLLFGIVSSPEDNGGDHLFPMFTASTLVLKDKRLCKYIFQGSGKDDVRLCLKTRVHGLREQLVKLNLCQMNPYQGVYLYGGSRKNTLLLVLVTVDGARRGENEMNEGVRREAVFDRNARDLRKVQSVLSTAVGGAKSVLPRHAAVVLCGE
jgi:hypothetical protein